jgi:hypothetical protein
MNKSDYARVVLRRKRNLTDYQDYNDDKQFQDRIRIPDSLKKMKICEFNENCLYGDSLD